MMRRTRGVMSRGKLLLTAYWLALLSATLASVLLGFPSKSYLLPVIALAFPVYLTALKLDAAGATGEADLAFTDEVTGLGNRRAFNRDARKAIASGRPGEVGIILFDVNGLKALNDQCGHPAGDELLTSISSHIAFANGRLYRLGGDEFGALLSLQNGQSIQTYAGDITTYVTSFESCGHRHEVRLTAGAAANGATEDFEALFQRADQLLLRNKRALYTTGSLPDRRSVTLDRTVGDARQRIRESRLRLLR